MVAHGLLADEERLADLGVRAARGEVGEDLALARGEGVEASVLARGGALDKKFLPDGLSRAHELEFLSRDEQRFLSQVQGRTYARMFGLVERFINAKALELTNEHRLGDQVALEALVRFSDEELKHQELFRRVDDLASEVLPDGQACVAQADDVARLVLSKSTWAVLGLTLHIELFSQQHYKSSIAPDAELSELFKDVFLFHWKEEAQHALIDELEWRRIDAGLDAAERERAVDELLALVAALDGILQAQSAADAAYFARHCGRTLSREALAAVERCVLAAYRWQYIGSGIGGRFKDVLFELLDAQQQARVGKALASPL